MINQQVTKQHATYFRNVAHYPVNVCLHCGESDDPEGYWEEDEDGDRICRKCHALAELKRESSIVSDRIFTEAARQFGEFADKVMMDLDAKLAEVNARHGLSELDAEIDRRQRQTPVEIDRRVA